MSEICLRRCRATAGGRRKPSQARESPPPGAPFLQDAIIEVDRQESVVKTPPFVEFTSKTRQFEPFQIAIDVQKERRFQRAMQNVTDRFLHSFGLWIPHFDRGF